MTANIIKILLDLVDLPISLKFDLSMTVFAH